MPAMRIVVRGRVQGVGFRYFAQQTARSMGIAGEVWNRADGSVEVHAEHADQKVVDAFAEALEAGPGYVRDIQLESAAERGCTEFEVGPTR
jgi:acylphosphatase